MALHMAAGGFCLNPLWAQNWYNTTDSVTSSISQTFHIRMCHMGLFPPWDLKSLPLLSHSHALFFVPLLFLLRIKRPENDSTFRPVSRHLGLNPARFVSLFSFEWGWWKAWLVPDGSSWGSEVRMDAIFPDETLTTWRGHFSLISFSPARKRASQ